VAVAVALPSVQAMAGDAVAAGKSLPSAKAAPPATVMTFEVGTAAAETSGEVAAETRASHELGAAHAVRTART